MGGQIEEGAGGCLHRLGAFMHSKYYTQPDDRVGETLDDEYWHWLPPRERRQSVPPRQALQGVSDRPRIKCRVQYACVQREYGKNRSRCAQNVISDA